PGAATPFAGSVGSYRYVSFEERFRGSPEAIRDRQTAYLPLFEGSSDVLDVGCGRGEFLALLREHGVRASGVDVNRAMVQICLEQGLEASEGDALTYLQALPDGSLGGLMAAQVVEHLEPSYLSALLDTAFVKLRPGAVMVLETINPACWYAFFAAYIRDITHVRPLHPDTLQYMVMGAGFHPSDVRYLNPYPDNQKLQPVSAAPGTALADVAETLNANVDRINNLLFTWLDYAVVGRRP
ncbi:MAG: class I SAM-dependent methyltransferase, partial [Acidimicrobiia bacterium]|nr:class I SAM-dependent methyltransferase [Acidimicrobiia bacterium]